MRRAIRFSLVAVLFAGTFAATGQGVALAAVEDCPDGSVCVWRGSQFTGDLAMTDRPTSGCVPGISRSAANRSEELRLVFWSEDGCSGDRLVLAPGEQAEEFDVPTRSVQVETVPPCPLGFVTLLCQ